MNVCHACGLIFGTDSRSTPTLSTEEGADLLLQIGRRVSHLPDAKIVGISTAFDSRSGRREVVLTLSCRYDDKSDDPTPTTSEKAAILAALTEVAR